MQGNEIAAQLTPLATSAVELAAEDKFTLFAPADSAFAAAGDIPIGDVLAQVHPSHACGISITRSRPTACWGQLYAQLCNSHEYIVYSIPRMLSSCLAWGTHMWRNVVFVGSLAEESGSSCWLSLVHTWYHNVFISCFRMFCVLCSCL